MIDDLTEALKLTSICGLGQFAHAPLSSVLQHFREEIDAHIYDHRCPEGRLSDARSACLKANHERRPDPIDH